MDTSACITLTIQEVLQRVCTFLGLHKNQGEGILACRMEQVLICEATREAPAFQDGKPELTYLKHFELKQ